MENVKDVMNKVLYAEIDRLKDEEEKLKKQLNKALCNFNTNDIDKLNKLSNSINQINFAINNLYALIGGLEKRLELLSK